MLGKLDASRCFYKKNSSAELTVQVLQQQQCMSVCVCVVIPFVLDVRVVDVPAGVTQEEGHTGFLHLSSAVLALIFLARRIQSFLSLVDREVESCVLPGNELVVLPLLGILLYLLFLFFVRKNPNSCDCTEI